MLRERERWTRPWVSGMPALKYAETVYSHSAMSSYAFASIAIHMQLDKRTYLPYWVAHAVRHIRSREQNVQGTLAAEILIESFGIHTFGVEID